MSTKSPTEKKIIIILVVAMVLYIATFIAICLWKYYHFYYDNFDLAIFNQVFWNTLHGKWFASTLQPPTYLADHFTPIIILLLPFYALKPGPQTLLILQTIILALSAWPVFLIAQYIFKTKSWLAVWIALLWLMNPFVHNVNFFGFHLVPFAVFFILWAIYFYLKKKFTIFLLMTILVLLTREDMTFIIFIFSLLAWIDRRSWKWRLTPAILALLYALFSFNIISYFSPHDSYKFLIYYGWLGGDSLLTTIQSFLYHPVAVTKHILTVSNLAFILGLTFPFFFLVLSKNKYLLLLLPPLAQRLLTHNGGNVEILQIHVVALFLPALFLTFIFAIDSLFYNNKSLSFLHAKHSSTFLIIVITTATILSALLYGSISLVYENRFLTHQEKQKWYSARSIPDTSSVAATSELLNPLSSRDNIYNIFYAQIGKQQFALADYTLPDDTEYIVINWEDILKNIMLVKDHPLYGPYSTNTAINMRSILKNYNLKESSGSLTIWQKNKKNTASSQSYDVLTSLMIDEQQNTLENPVYSELFSTIYGITVSWLMPESVDKTKEYYIHITTNERQFSLPLAYGLYTAEDFDVYNKLTMNIPFEDTETSVQLQLFSYSYGDLILGKLRNHEMQSNAQLVGSTRNIKRTL